MDLISANALQISQSVHIVEGLLVSYAGLKISGHQAVLSPNACDCPVTSNVAREIPTHSNREYW